VVVETCSSTVVAESALVVVETCSSKVEGVNALVVAETYIGKVVMCNKEVVGRHMCKACSQQQRWLRVKRP
jgi:hypothetical protein